MTAQAEPQSRPGERASSVALITEVARRPGTWSAVPPGGPAPMLMHPWRSSMPRLLHPARNPATRSPLHAGAPASHALHQAQPTRAAPQRARPEAAGYLQGAAREGQRHPRYGRRPGVARVRQGPAPRAAGSTHVSPAPCCTSHRRAAPHGTATAGASTRDTKRTDRSFRATPGSVAQADGFRPWQPDVGSPAR